MSYSFSPSIAGVLSSCCIAALVMACGSDADSDGPPTGTGGAAAGLGGSGGFSLAGAKSVGGTSGASLGGMASSGATGIPSAGTNSGRAGSGGDSSAGAGTAGSATSSGGREPGAGAGGRGGTSNVGGASGAAGGKSTNGGAAAGGKSAGGASGSPGNSGSGGAAGSGGSKSAGGSGNVPAIGPGPCGCEKSAGEFGMVNSTIVVAAGEVYDGQCKTYRANPDTLGAGDQEEGQLPVFRVNDGGTLRNVILGASAADGVHVYGDVTLENIHWLDIGEDAMTVKESGTVRLTCGSAAQGADKMFQVNAASDIFISHFTGKDAGKFMRQNGGTTFKVSVTIDHCDISNMGEVIFRTDSTTSHVTLTNTRYSDLADGLFMFGDDVVNGNSSQSTVSNNMEY